MRKQDFFFVLLLLFFSLKSFSQFKELSQAEAKQVTVRITEHSREINTITSSFKQIKHLDFLSDDIVSKGNLVFKAPDLIKWEYHSPYRYVVVFKNNKLLINDEGVKSRVDLGSNSTFKSLNELIIKSVRGNMFDKEQFTIQYFKSDESYRISFTPVSQSLKSLINTFILFFDKQTFEVTAIKMMENEEDYTEIIFSDQKINTIVSDEVFTN